MPYGSHSGAAAAGAVAPASLAVAQLHLRRWQSQRRQSLLRFAQAQSKSALALFKRLASKPEPSQCPEQRHWLHCTCQPIVSRISCDLALAGCRMAVTAAQRQSAQLHLRRWQSQRRQSLLRFALAHSKSATDSTSAGRTGSRSATEAAAAVEMELAAALARTAQTGSRFPTE